MGAPGAWPQLEPGPPARSTADPVVGDRPLPRGIDNHAPAGAAGQLLHPGLDTALGLGRLALDDRPIDFFDLAAGKQRAQPPQRFRMAAEYEAAAGVPIDPMGEGRRSRQAKTQAIEAAFEIGTAAGAGMHRNPRGLVDDQDQPIAIENPSGQRFPQSTRHSPLPIVRVSGKATGEARSWPHQSIIPPRRAWREPENDRAE